MPPKNCGSCSKLVYPMDELKCLDKVWHKSCFRCQVCSMTLNMKNYKGYSKLPYCNAHYPTTKFTSVAETPEIRRIAQNTKLQSNIKYHAEFEAAKGQYTAVTDDPETLRVRKNMETISNVAYHGDMIRKQEMENARPSEVESSSPPSAAPAPTPIAAARREPAVAAAVPPRQPGSISDYNPLDNSRNHEYTSQPQSTTVYTSSQRPPSVSGGRNKRVGSITDYDPINDHYGSIVGQYKDPRSDSPPVPAQQPISGQPAPSFPPPVAVQRAPSPPPAEPEVFEPEPMKPEPAAPEPPAPEPVAPEPIAPEPVAPEPIPDDIPAASDKGNMSKALYDYAAGDDDEVSFAENDIIVNCEPIDDGWMTGTVEKTGETGMLPSNYVERLNW